MKAKNIVLIGMMGAGKSLVAKALAEQLQRRSYSTDALVEKKCGKSISRIVADKGWDYFRRQEHLIVARLAKRKNIIIDCGGGIVLNPLNLKLLRKHGIIFYLKASPSVIYQRIKGDPHRPLVQTPNPLAAIRRIYKERLPLYNQADQVIDASKASIRGPVARIISQSL